MLQKWNKPSKNKQRTKFNEEVLLSLVHISDAHEVHLMADITMHM